MNKEQIDKLFSQIENISKSLSDEEKVYIGNKCDEIKKSIGYDKIMEYVELEQTTENYKRMIVEKFKEDEFLEIISMLPNAKVINYNFEMANYIVWIGITIEFPSFTIGKWALGDRDSPEIDIDVCIKDSKLEFQFMEADYIMTNDEYFEEDFNKVYEKIGFKNTSRETFLKFLEESRYIWP